MFKTIIKIFNNLSIKVKIFILYILILCITFFTLLTSYTYIIGKETRKEVTFSAQKSLNQTKSFLDFKTASSKEIANILASNNQLQEVLKTRKTVYEENVGSWSTDRDKLYKAIYASQTNPDIKAIKIYMEEGPTTAYETSTLFRINTFKQIVSFDDYNYLEPSIQWHKGIEFADDTLPEDIVLLKNIVSNANYQQNIGVIRMDFDANVFTDVLNETNITATSTAMLCTPDYILCNSDTTNKKVDATLLTAVQRYANGLTINQYPYWEKEAMINGQKMMIGVEEIKLTNWKLVLIIPETDVLSSISQARKQSVFLFLFILPLSFVLTYVVTISTTRRLSKLATEMHNIDISTFHKEITPSSKDEIGILTQNFNYMLTKISMLLDETYELGKTAKNAELLALQAQINPHFLYNTLDQIYWMGIRHNIPEISNLVIDLSKFYKSSLSKGKSIVSLENEMDMIGAYVNIQNVRFDNIITLEITIAEEFLQYQIPKITLQPIVENAILHGIYEKDEPGTIQIRAYTREAYLYLSVCDNGLGMDLDTLSMLRGNLGHQVLDQSNMHGYGLANIDHRIKIFYGAEYGLEIESEYQVGTTVLLRLPREGIA